METKATATGTPVLTTTVGGETEQKTLPEKKESGGKLFAFAALELVKKMLAPLASLGVKLPTVESLDDQGYLKEGEVKQEAKADTGKKLKQFLEKPEVQKLDPKGSEKKRKIAEYLQAETKFPLLPPAEQGAFLKSQELSEVAPHLKQNWTVNRRFAHAFKVEADQRLATDGKTAVKLYDMALQWDPENGGLHSQAAWALNFGVTSQTDPKEAAQAYDRALRHLQVATAKDPKDYVAWRMAAQILVKAGRAEDAPAVYSEALSAAKASGAAAEELKSLEAEKKSAEEKAQPIWSREQGARPAEISDTWVLLGPHSPALSLEERGKYLTGKDVTQTAYVAENPAADRLAALMKKAGVAPGEVKPFKDPKEIKGGDYLNYAFANYPKFQKEIEACFGKLPFKKDDQPDPTLVTQLFDFNSAETKSLMARHQQLKAKVEGGNVDANHPDFKLLEMYDRFLLSPKGTLQQKAGLYLAIQGEEAKTKAKEARLTLFQPSDAKQVETGYAQAGECYDKAFALGGDPKDAKAAAENFYTAAAFAPKGETKGLYLKGVSSLQKLRLLPTDTSASALEKDTEALKLMGLGFQSAGLYKEAIQAFDLAFVAGDKSPALSGSIEANKKHLAAYEKLGDGFHARFKDLEAREKAGKLGEAEAKELKALRGGLGLIERCNQISLPLTQPPAEPPVVAKVRDQVVASLQFPLDLKKVEAAEVAVKRLEVAETSLKKMELERAKVVSQAFKDAPYVGAYLDKTGDYSWLRLDYGGLKPGDEWNAEALHKLPSLQAYRELQKKDPAAAKQIEAAFQVFQEPKLVAGLDKIDSLEALEKGVGAAEAKVFKTDAGGALPQQTDPLTGEKSKVFESHPAFGVWAIEAEKIEMDSNPAAFMRNALGKNQESVKAIAKALPELEKAAQDLKTVETKLAAAKQAGNAADTEALQKKAAEIQKNLGALKEFLTAQVADFEKDAATYQKHAEKLGILEKDGSVPFGKEMAAAKLNVEKLKKQLAEIDIAKDPQQALTVLTAHFKALGGSQKIFLKSLTFADAAMVNGWRSANPDMAMPGPVSSNLMDTGTEPKPDALWSLKNETMGLQWDLEKSKLNKAFGDRDFTDAEIQADRDQHGGFAFLADAPALEGRLKATESYLKKNDQQMFKTLQTTLGEGLEFEIEKWSQARSQMAERGDSTKEIDKLIDKYFQAKFALRDGDTKRALALYREALDSKRSNAVFQQYEESNKKQMYRTMVLEVAIISAATLLTAGTLSAFAASSAVVVEAGAAMEVGAATIGQQAVMLGLESAAFVGWDKAIHYGLHKGTGLVEDPFKGARDAKGNLKLDLLAADLTFDVVKNMGLFKTLRTAGEFYQVLAVGRKVLANPAAKGLIEEAAKISSAHGKVIFKQLLEIEMANMGKFGKVAFKAGAFATEAGAMQTWNNLALILEVPYQNAMHGKKLEFSTELKNVNSLESVEHGLLQLIGLKLGGFGTHPLHAEIVSGKTQQAALGLKIKHFGELREGLAQGLADPASRFDPKFKAKIAEFLKLGDHLYAAGGKGGALPPEALEEWKEVRTSLDAVLKVEAQLKELVAKAKSASDQLQADMKAVVDAAKGIASPEKTAELEKGFKAGQVVVASVGKTGSAEFHLVSKSEVDGDPAFERVTVGGTVFFRKVTDKAAYEAYQAWLHRTTPPPLPKAAESQKPQTKPVESKAGAKKPVEPQAPPSDMAALAGAKKAKAEPASPPAEKSGVQDKGNFQPGGDLTGEAKGGEVSGAKIKADLPALGPGPTPTPFLEASPESLRARDPLPPWTGGEAPGKSAYEKAVAVWNELVAPKQGEAATIDRWAELARLAEGGDIQAKQALKVLEEIHHGANLLKTFGKGEGLNPEMVQVVETKLKSDLARLEFYKKNLQPALDGTAQAKEKPQLIARTVELSGIERARDVVQEMEAKRANKEPLSPQEKALYLEKKAVLDQYKVACRQAEEFINDYEAMALEKQAEGKEGEIPAEDKARYEVEKAWLKKYGVLQKVWKVLGVAKDPAALQAARDVDLAISQMQDLNARIAKLEGEIPSQSGGKKAAAETELKQLKGLRQRNLDLIQQFDKVQGEYGEYASAFNKVVAPFAQDEVRINARETNIKLIRSDIQQKYQGDVKAYYEAFAKRTGSDKNFYALYGEDVGKFVEAEILPPRSSPVDFISVESTPLHEYRDYEANFAKGLYGGADRLPLKMHFQVKAADRGPMMDHLVKKYSDPANNAKIVERQEGVLVIELLKPPGQRVRITVEIPAAEKPAPPEAKTVPPPKMKAEPDAGPPTVKPGKGKSALDPGPESAPPTVKPGKVPFAAPASEAGPPTVKVGKAKASSPTAESVAAETDQLPPGLRAIVKETAKPVEYPELDIIHTPQPAEIHALLEGIREIGVEKLEAMLSAATGLKEVPPNHPAAKLLSLLLNKATHPNDPTVSSRCMRLLKTASNRELGLLLRTDPKVVELALQPKHLEILLHDDPKAALEQIAKVSHPKLQEFLTSQLVLKEFRVAKELPPGAQPHKAALELLHLFGIEPKEHAKFPWTDGDLAQRASLFFQVKEKKAEMLSLFQKAFPGKEKEVEAFLNEVWEVIRVQDVQDTILPYTPHGWGHSMEVLRISDAILMGSPSVQKELVKSLGSVEKARALVQFIGLFHDAGYGCLQPNESKGIHAERSGELFQEKFRERIGKLFGIQDPHLLDEIYLAIDRHGADKPHEHNYMEASEKEHPLLLVVRMADNLDLTADRMRNIQMHPLMMTSLKEMYDLGLKPEFKAADKGQKKAMLDAIRDRYLGKGGVFEKQMSPEDADLAKDLLQRLNETTWPHFKGCEMVLHHHTQEVTDPATGKTKLVVRIEIKGQAKAGEVYEYDKKSQEVRSIDAALYQVYRLYVAAKSLSFQGEPLEIRTLEGDKTILPGTDIVVDLGAIEGKAPVSKRFTLPPAPAANDAKAYDAAAGIDTKGSAVSKGPAAALGPEGFSVAFANGKGPEKIQLDGRPLIFRRTKDGGYEVAAFGEVEWVTAKGGAAKKIPASKLGGDLKWTRIEVGDKLGAKQTAFHGAAEAKPAAMGEGEALPIVGQFGSKPAATAISKDSPWVVQERQGKKVVVAHEVTGERQVFEAKSEKTLTPEIQKGVRLEFAPLVAGGSDAKISKHPKVHLKGEDLAKPALPPLAPHPEAGDFFIGRDSSNPAIHYVIDNPMISRSHATLSARKDPAGGVTWVLIDGVKDKNEKIKPSSLGVWVDGGKITGETVVRPGQKIRIGFVDLDFQPQYPVGSASTPMPKAKFSPTRIVVTAEDIGNKSYPPVNPDPQGGIFVIGRDSTNPIVQYVIQNQDISRVHAVVFSKPGPGGEVSWFITDGYHDTKDGTYYPSKWGVTVDGKQVKGQSPLKPGQKIGIGYLELDFAPKPGGAFDAAAYAGQVQGGGAAIAKKGPEAEGPADSAKPVFTNLADGAIQPLKAADGGSYELAAGITLRRGADGQWELHDGRDPAKVKRMSVALAKNFAVMGSWKDAPLFLNGKEVEPGKPVRIAPGDSLQFIDKFVKFSINEPQPLDGELAKLSPAAQQAFAARLAAAGNFVDLKQAVQAGGFASGPKVLTTLEACIEGKAPVDSLPEALRTPVLSVMVRLTKDMKKHLPPGFEPQLDLKAYPGGLHPSERAYHAARAFLLFEQEMKFATTLDEVQKAVESTLLDNPEGLPKSLLQLDLQRFRDGKIGIQDIPKGFGLRQKLRDIWEAKNLQLMEDGAVASVKDPGAAAALAELDGLAQKLYAEIGKSGTVHGSAKSYGAVELRELVYEVLERGKPLEQITTQGGLRAKVEAYMKATISRAKQTFKSNLDYFDKNYFTGEELKERDFDAKGKDPKYVYSLQAHYRFIKMMLRHKAGQPIYGQPSPKEVALLQDFAVQKLGAKDAKQYSQFQAVIRQHLEKLTPEIRSALAGANQETRALVMEVFFGASRHRQMESTGQAMAIATFLGKIGFYRELGVTLDLSGGKAKVNLTLGDVAHVSPEDRSVYFVMHTHPNDYSAGAGAMVGKATMVLGLAQAKNSDYAILFSDTDLRIFRRSAEDIFQYNKGSGADVSVIYDPKRRVFQNWVQHKQGISRAEVFLDEHGKAKSILVRYGVYPDPGAKAKVVISGGKILSDPDAWSEHRLSAQRLETLSKEFGIPVKVEQVDAALLEQDMPK